MQLTRTIPSPAVYGANSFGVRQKSRGFPPISPQSVLYAIGRLALGLTAASFGRNQLSPGLIGLSPLAQGYPTELHIRTGSALHQAKLGFSLPRTRSPGFGSSRRDSGRYSHPVPHPFGLRTFCFRSGSGDSSLASPRHETPWPVILDGRHDPDSLPSYRRLTTASFGEDQFFRAVPTITTWFQALLTPLPGCFSTFPRGTASAIGLGTYLGLGVDASQLRTPFPRRPIQDTPPLTLRSYTYGTFTL